jgi:peptide/nickel transport system permease protein
MTVVAAVAVVLWQGVRVPPAAARARVSLFTALAVGVAILIIGIAVELVAGFAGGVVDGLLMRTVDVLLAFPSLLLALAITGMLGPGLMHLMIGMTPV